MDMRKHPKLKLAGATLALLLAVVTVSLMPVNAVADSLWEFSLNPSDHAHPTLTFFNITDLKSFESGKESLVGDLHYIYLKNDGTVWTSGTNMHGELGIGNNSYACINRVCPIVQVLGENGIGYLQDIKAVSAGKYFSLALKNDGTVWAWGANFGGRLGVGSSANHVTTPMKIVGPGGTDFLTDVSAVSAGWNGWGQNAFGHSLALKSGGTVWAWGDGVSGELGNGSHGLNYFSAYPVQVIADTEGGVLTDVKSISAGQSFSLALKNDGTVWSWGSNGNGALGNGSTGIADIAQQVHGVGNIGYLTNILRISGSGQHCMAMGGGHIYTWGSNYYGELCNGTTTNSNLPVVIADIPTACEPPIICGPYELSAGTSFTLFRSGGIISACGLGFGYIGSSPYNYGTSLAEVPSIHDAAAISAGGTALVLGPTAANTSLQIESSKNPSDYGQNVTFTVTVSSSGGIPTGTVLFSLDGSYWGDPVALNGSGIATYSTSSLSVGYDQIYFKYNGDYNFKPSTNSMWQSVNPSPTTVALTSSLNPCSDTDTVTFTATVTPSDATGQVDFYDDTTLMGSSDLSGGTASIVVSDLDLGQHPITAYYEGDGTYPSATSPVLTQIVAYPATVTLSDLNQIYDGTPKNATVTTSPPDLSYDITYDGSYTAPTAAGSYAVIATITDPDYFGSKSGTLTISVGTCPDHAVKIKETSGYYQTISAAFADAASSGQSILIQALDLGETLTLADKSVTLQGGYYCDFGSNPGFATIRKMTIGGTSGTITIDRIVLSSSEN